MYTILHLSRKISRQIKQQIQFKDAISTNHITTFQTNRKVWSTYNSINKAIFHVKDKFPNVPHSSLISCKTPPQSQ